eukprot:ANDGO_03595.mRNA.1 Uncharacterized protein YsfE
MKLGYIILYVPDVPQAVEFYEKAFQCTKKFVHESSTYGEIASGSTTLAFAAESLIHSQGISFTASALEHRPSAFEIAFVTEDVESAYQHAILSGAVAVKDPVKKPWGQLVAHVRDLNGVLVELCSPIS